MRNDHVHAFFASNVALNAPFSVTIHASGGSAPFTFTLLSGALPLGLTLSSGGLLSGTPTTSGTYSFRIRARDSRGCLGSRTYTMTVGCTTLLLSPPTLGAAALGVPYSQALTASGGQAPSTFAVTAGALPGGLTLSAGGVISGTPTAAGSFSFTVTATDPNGCTGSRTYTLAICPVLTISPALLPNATAGTPYSQPLAVSGGTEPSGFVVTAGALPPGVTLSATGLLSGTPTAAGNFTFTVIATDANGCTASATYTLAVCSPVAISPPSLPFGAVSVAYIANLSATGGTPPHSFTASGEVPPGLTLSSSGTLAGTPTLSGGFTFTVTATDAGGCAGSRTYTIGVTEAPPVITSLRLTPGPGEGFTLAVLGSGFVDGGTIFVNGVAFPVTFVSPTLVTVVLPAAAVPTTGSITVTVTNPGPTGATSNPASLTFCEPPAAPVNPTIEPFGNPTGPLTATDFLVVRWQAPAAGPPPAAYEFRINGDPYTTVVGATSAVVPPRGSNDPITLFVRAKCNEQVTGPETSSPTYSLSPPVADFTFSAARVGTPATFTDTSSPQATSWLWIFDDGGTSTLQSPTHTFTTAGTHQVALIASNGSGSSQTIKDVLVSAATSGSGAVTSSLARFANSDGSRWKLAGVPFTGAGPVWLQIAPEQPEETVVYLRFLDPGGLLVLERRLSIAGEGTVNDVSAFGLEGVYTLELVSGRRIEATLRQPFDLEGKRSRAE